MKNTELRSIIIEQLDKISSNSTLWIINDFIGTLASCEGEAHRRKTCHEAAEHGIMVS